MKKVLMIILPLLFLTGCSNLNKSTLEQIEKDVLSSKVSLTNQFRNGYKYYLPRDLNVIENLDYNEIITNNKYKYYLYVDIISYNNKTKNDYIIYNSAYYSNKIKNGEKFGYLEINKQKNKYLVEMMYNYAKIEVMVEEKDINKAVTDSIVILSSIEYNNNVINHLMGDSEFNASEKDFNIFKTKKDSSNFINYINEYDTYKEDEEVPDLDLVK